MIRLVDVIPESALTGESPMSARIYTQSAAYQGLRDAPELYLADGGALLSMFDGVLTIDGGGFDPDELRRFAEMRGCHTVACSEREASRLGFAGAAAGMVMRYGGETPEEDGEICRDAKLDDVFALLCAVFDNMRGTVFEHWYCDVSLKKRRGLAYIYGIYAAGGGQTGGLCSTAGVYYQNARTAVIGSVATTEAARGQGMAAKLLCALVGRIRHEGKTPQIICRSEQAHALYCRLGFADVGAFFEIPVQ